jgi:hypothetical protein
MLLVGLQAMRKKWASVRESQGDRPINHFLAMLRPPMGPAAEFWKSRMRPYKIIRIWHAYLYTYKVENRSGMRHQDDYSGAHDPIKPRGTY